MICWAAIGLLALSSLWSRPALIEIGTGAPPTDAELVRPLTYLLLSPLAAPLDGLSLLALSQHIALLLTLVLMFIGWRVARRRGPRPWRRAVPAEAGATALFLGSLVGLYALMAYAPRPVGSLRTLDPNLVVVDFHSHTRFSHDVSERFDAGWNRQSHRRVGFDAAYLTDHGGWAGLNDALAGNPPRAGDGLVLLAGSELWLRDENTLALGDTATYVGELDEQRISLRPEEGSRTELGSRTEAGEDTLVRPTLLLTLPARRPEAAVGWAPDQPWGFVGMEISDASPKGLEQGRRDRAALLDVARREHLALVSGTNNHGAGRSAAAWTLMGLPGWRELSPTALGQRIEGTLHDQRRGATRVVERTMPYPNPFPLVALTLPTFLWHTLATLSLAERAVWLSYLLGLWIARRGATTSQAGPRVRRFV